MNYIYYCIGEKILYFESFRWNILEILEDIFFMNLTVLECCVDGEIIIHNSENWYAI